jgi:hypothetical protein
LAYAGGRRHRARAVATTTALHLSAVAVAALVMAARQTCFRAPLSTTL